VDREIVLLALILSHCGATAWLAGLLPIRRWPALSPREHEGQLWIGIWKPLLACGLLIMLLVGWAIQEPAYSDERIRLGILAVVVPVGLVWLRAAARALRAVIRGHVDAPAATIGLFRPRVVIHPRLSHALDEDALRAAVAHEDAHRRHRDPLRIWLAQLATDLQWPFPAARRRLVAWRHALELARDDEAVENGTSGLDLAAAVLAAAQLPLGPHASAPAALTGSGAGLLERIDRLLAPARLPVSRPTPCRVAPRVLVAVLLACALVVGIVHGDPVVQLLPGVIP